MKKFNILLTTVAILSVAFCEAVRAENEIDCPTGSSATSTCWSCGETCTAKFDSATHTMTFSGTGAMDPDAANNSSPPWGYITSSIHSVVVEEGITSLAGHLFHNYYQNTGNITFISLPTSLNSIGDAAFGRLWYGDQVEGLVIPENVTEWGSSVFYMSHGNLYCPKSQIIHCTPNQHGNSSGMTVSGYEKIDDMYYIYDSEGNVEAIYDTYNNFSDNVKKPVAERLSQKDENGNITVYDTQGRVAAKYSANQGITKFSYGADGSISTYNKDGKLIAKTGKNFTMEELMLLLKDNNNAVSITW